MDSKTKALANYEGWLNQQDDDVAPILSFRSKAGLKIKKKEFNNSKERFQISDLNLHLEDSKQEPAILVRAASLSRKQSSFFDAANYNSQMYASDIVLLEEQAILSRASAPKHGLPRKQQSQNDSSLKQSPSSNFELSKGSPLPPSRPVKSSPGQSPLASSMKRTTFNSVLSDFSKQKSYLAKEIFFLEKKYAVSSSALKPVLTYDEETLLLTTGCIPVKKDQMTILSRAVQTEDDDDLSTGFSVYALIKETELYSPEDILEDHYFFYFVNEVEREKFQFLDSPNAVRAHWAVHNPNCKKAIHSTRSVIVPYTIITYTIIDETMLFLETSSSGPVINNSFIEMPVSNFIQSKDRSDNTSTKRILCSKKIKDFIHTTWEHSPIPIADSKELVDTLVKIESHKKAVMRNFNIGVFYRKAKQEKRQEICSNMDPPPHFYEFLKTCGYRGEERVPWRHVNITWHIAALLDEDGIRQKIGNSMFIIIYSDDPEPFDPSYLYLGQLSTVVCVVRPVNVLSEKLALQAKQQFQLNFYLCYDSKIVVEDLTGPITQIELFNCDPQVPPNYIFTQSNVFDFIISKFSNCLSQIVNHHPSFGSQFYTPIAHFVEKIVKEAAPAYHQKNLEALERKKKKLTKQTSNSYSSTI